MTAMLTTPHIPTIAPVDVRPRAGFGAWWRDTLVFTGRQIAHIRQIPEKLLDVTLQPLMFVLLFSYVFSGAMTIGGDYREYLIGGILIQSLAFGLIGPATAMATDIGEGVVDRFRTLPTPRGAYLSGQFLAELLGMAVGIVVVLGTGLIVGWRPHELGPSLLAMVLILLFASVMVWIGIFLGLKVRTPDAVMGVGFVVVFPLTFLSNAFVPVDSLPAALQTIAEWNPVSVLVAAVRELFGNPTQIEDPSWPLQHAVPVAFVLCVLLLAAVVPLALRAYRIRTRD
jgi:ABC-2 type transport system permease protein